MSARPGDVLSTFRLPVDASKAREMALALGAAEWSDLTAEQLWGRVVVPTFTACSGHWQDRRELMTGPLGLDLPRTLHGEQRWRFTRPVRVGDLLDGETSLHSIEEREGRRGGRMRFVTLRTSYSAKGEQVLTEDMVLIETEPPNGPPPAPAANPKGDQKGEAAPSAPVELPEPEGPLLAPEQRIGPITRTDIVRYAGASGDFNRIHHDDPYAKMLGLPQVFTMGMLQGGMVGVHLAAAVPEGSIRSLSLRFRDRLWPGETLLIRGWWQPDEPGGCALEARAEDGRLIVTATGQVEA